MGLKLEELFVQLGLRTDSGAFAAGVAAIDGLGVALGGLKRFAHEAVGALRKNVVGTAELGAQMARSAADVGAPAEALQELEDAARRAGMPFVELQRAVGAAGRSGGEVLSSLAEIGSGMRETSETAAGLGLAMQRVGRSPELAAFLSTGRLRVGDFREEAERLGSALGGTLIPLVVETADAFGTWGRAGRAWVASDVAAFVQRLGDVVAAFVLEAAAFAVVLGAADGALRGVAAALGGVTRETVEASGGLSRLGQAVVGVGAAFAVLVAEFDSWKGHGEAISRGWLSGTKAIEVGMAGPAGRRPWWLAALEDGALRARELRTVVDDLAAHSFSSIARAEARLLKVTMGASRMLGGNVLGGARGMAAGGARLDAWSASDGFGGGASPSADAAVRSAQEVREPTQAQAPVGAAGRTSAAGGQAVLVAPAPTFNVHFYGAGDPKENEERMRRIVQDERERSNRETAAALHRYDVVSQ